MTKSASAVASNKMFPCNGPPSGNVASQWLLVVGWCAAERTTANRCCGRYDKLVLLAHETE